MKNLIVILLLFTSCGYDSIIHNHSIVTSKIMYGNNCKYRGKKAKVKVISSIGFEFYGPCDLYEIGDTVIMYKK